ncbi:DUF4365 domain-containing protein [Rhizobium leguminosarum bv. viciae]|uniref:DUF4365 domain-containing protein n=1 Tax=Rhizobium leguminosarum TaxID=384 RepID=UPI0014414E85|nr:DUF4365 domain-containing protein [Rhizobium leguminosarum]NKL63908.1 DUF4365 domain-containing protein [Rhizobium leguminosarum bv. viciae]NKL71842.1 DUF4365 domain-containing protein [Rhizobium leguminosarum bv. viciae]NKL83816.1 DUF4365 domain-containing protein [Rhizobium leguminosarum bv. viciae]
MQPLTPQNIESELSYAYLHAVASAAGMACEICGRHEDNAGADARIVAWAPFQNGGYKTEVELKIQLKATVKTPTLIGDRFSYPFKGIKRYDDLRAESLAIPRILVVLFLPTDSQAWIDHSEEALLLRRCAYWVSLRGADPSTNDSTQTIYIPTTQKFDVKGLAHLMASLSRDVVPSYARVREDDE